MHATVQEVDFSTVDLIFIDDSRDIEDRARTISAVYERCTDGSVAIIHDFKQAVYIAAAARFLRRFSFDDYLPHSGLVSKGLFVDWVTVRDLNHRIARWARHIDPDDVDAWVRIFPRRSS
jgi:hypothetical protein